MITRLGYTEQQILDLLKSMHLNNYELCLGIYNSTSPGNKVKMDRSCKSLIKKGLIKKKGNNFYFIKELDVISEIRGKQQIISVPKRKQTKTWKNGDKIKLINLDRK